MYPLGRNMKRKTILKVSLVIIIIGIILGLLYWDKYKEKQKYINEANKFQSILELTENPGGNATKPIDDPNSKGTDMTLINRLDVIDSFKDETDGILVVNSLIDSFRFLQIIREDNIKHDINRYYESNKAVIQKLYGIESLESFEKFVNKINNIETLRDYKIHTETIEEVGNITTFNLEFMASEPVIIKMKVFISDRENKIINIYVLED